MSVRKKFDCNSTKKEIKYSRKTDFKNLSPLRISKNDNFVFENDVKLKLNYNNYAKLNSENNQKLNNNYNLSAEILKISNLNKKEDSHFSVLRDHNDKHKKINFDNNSNIQGVNKLSSNRLNLRELNKNHANEQKDEDNLLEKSKTSVNFYKPNRRSKSISSLEKIEDPKAFLKSLFVRNKDSKKAENEGNKLEISEEEITARQKLFILESDFNYIFNRTEKSINFKNNLIEKVEKIKKAKGLFNDKKPETANLNNDNSNSEKENFSSKLNSTKNLNSLLADNYFKKANQKIFEKMNDLNFDFNLSDKLNNLHSKNINFKSTLLNQEITFSKDNKYINIEDKKKLNDFNTFSQIAKKKIIEIKSIAENLRVTGEKDKKAESEIPIKNYNKISIEESKQELDKNTFKSNFLFFIYYLCTYSVIFFYSCFILKINFFQ